SAGCDRPQDALHRHHGAEGDQRKDRGGDRPRRRRDRADPTRVDQSRLMERACRLPPPTGGGLRCGPHAREAGRPLSGHELLMRPRGAARRAKNQNADAAASAVAKINNRQGSQDDSACTLAAAARSRSLTSFGSTTFTKFVTAVVTSVVLAASVASALVAAGAAPGALAPAPSVVGRTGQAVPAAATGLSPRLAALRG